CFYCLTGILLARAPVLIVKTLFVSVFCLSHWDPASQEPSAHSLWPMCVLS
ncbi:hypothetical protein NDU88_004687, partial [Pleurodeles waltl]